VLYRQQPRLLIVALQSPRADPDFALAVAGFKHWLVSSIRSGCGGEMAFAVSGAALGGAVRAPRLTGGEEGSLVFRRTGPFLTRNDPATPSSPSDQVWACLGSVCE
jgi:hypothetical protein